MTRELSRLLWDTYTVDWNAEKMHIFCLDHIINRAVQEFLKKIKVVSDGDPDAEEEDEENRAVVDGQDDDEETFAITLNKLRRLAKVHFHLTIRIHV